MTTKDLQKLCEDLYRDRAELVRYDAGPTERAAVFWILYGSLVSLLDVSPNFAPDIPAEQANEPFQAGVVALLEVYAPAEVAWRGVVADLAARLTGQYPER